MRKWNEATSTTTSLLSMLLNGTYKVTRAAPRTRKNNKEKINVLTGTIGKAQASVADCSWLTGSGGKMSAEQAFAWFLDGGLMTKWIAGRSEWLVARVSARLGWGLLPLLASHLEMLPLLAPSALGTSAS